WNLSETHIISTIHCGIYFPEVTVPQYFRNKFSRTLYSSRNGNPKSYFSPFLPILNYMFRRLISRFYFSGTLPSQVHPLCPTKNTFIYLTLSFANHQHLHQTFPENPHKHTANLFTTKEITFIKQSRVKI
ncbi:hypothetical protein VIGAN_10038400, partial [Vigna angularis var. angularis]